MGKNKVQEDQTQVTRRTFTQLYQQNRNYQIRTKTGFGIKLATKVRANIEERREEKKVMGWENG